jgi:septum formation inhibitor-activating ATPase MinD
MLNRQKISVTATGVDTGVAKHLEKENYDFVILDLPNQVTEMASQIASLPKVLKYLFEFNKMVDEPVQIIVIMNKKDTRLSSLEQLADHVVLKEPGWQSHLEFLLKGV